MGRFCLRHARELLTLARPLSGDPSADPWDEAPLGLIRDGAVLVDGDRIVAVGSTDALDPWLVEDPSIAVIEVGDRVLAPGLVDAHTHSLFAGSRAGEYALRVRGESYAAIAARGGGIAASVRSLRAADDAALSAQLAQHLATMRAHGTTTVEVKTGYALSIDDELRSLGIIAGAGAIPTWLPLHAVPPELRGLADGRARYLACVEGPMFDGVLRQGLARAIDAYIDGPGFSVAEVLPTLTRAKAEGFAIRLHVGQFEDVGGAELAASLGAQSVDHLEHVSAHGLDRLAAAGVTAVLLPGAAFSLGQSMPNARQMRARGVSVALATDFNPGTSHTQSLPLMAAFGVRQMGLSTVEAWHAITRVAADALGLADRGRIVPGARADLAVFAYPTYEALPYDFGTPRAVWAWSGGALTHGALG